MMTRSPALDPNSAPYFSVQIGSDSAEPTGAGKGPGLGFRIPIGAEDREAFHASSFSSSNSDLRSTNSSPNESIPTTDSGEGKLRSGLDSIPSGVSFSQHFDDRDKRLLPNTLRGPLRSLHDDDLFISSTNGNNDGEETPGPRAIRQWAMKAQTPASSTNDSIDFALPFIGPFQDSHTLPSNNTMPNRSMTNSTHSFNIPFKSTSPVSSIGSASINTSSVDYSSTSFEAQIKNSSIIRDLVDRLTRCEITNREIQRELAEVHGKINLLVERSLASLNSEPEFKNPFAPSVSASRSLTPSGGFGNTQMASQVGPLAKHDDLSQLSNRINSLTTSVGQLLALQTQQHATNLQQTFPPQGPLSLSQPTLDIAPNQGPPAPNILAQGIPNRPDLRPSPRVPNPPMRTWSAGTIDLLLRTPTDPINRPDSMHRDKRRSVAVVMRRDSAGVSVKYFVDSLYYV